MLRRDAILAGAMLVLAVPLPAQRASSDQRARVVAPTVAARQAGREPFDASATIKASTLGFGAEFGKLLTSNLGIRIGGSTLTYDRQQDVDEITFDGTLSLRSVQGFVDLFPFSRGAFRFTGGVVTGSNGVSATGVPDAAGEYTIDGQTYSGADVGTLLGDVDFPRTRPYFGFGWGTPASSKGGFGFVADFGAVYGAPELTLDATGAAASNAQFRADLEAQRQTAQRDIDKYARFYPVIGLGLSYRF